ncbi:MAG: transposase, partial [Pseudonocardia sp.]|nr:transposase [Pseudonocardia sp.]
MDLAGWVASLDAVVELISGRFARSEPRQRVGSYLRGLLAGLERRNLWTLAEHSGAASPDGMQRPLRTADWDVEGVRDDLGGYVLEQLGDEASGVFIVDETGFIKKGVRSAGVQRQYTGTIGKIDNCQLGVFGFATKPELGVAMLSRAKSAPGGPGTRTSLWPCSPPPTSPPLAPTRPKRGIRSPWRRADPAERQRDPRTPRGPRPYTRSLRDHRDHLVPLATSPPTPSPSLPPPTQRPTTAALTAECAALLAASASWPAHQAADRPEDSADVCRCHGSPGDVRGFTQRGKPRNGLILFAGREHAYRDRHPPADSPCRLPNP